MTIKKIEIITQEDTSDCDTCGHNYDCGGYVRVDGEEVFGYEPVAACWGNATYDEGDLLFLALKALGIEITVDGDVPYAFLKYNP